MSSYLPTLKQLQYLVALKEQGHFGKAADACFVTQSTLSAGCLLYTSPSPRDRQKSRMPSSA